MLLRLTQRMLFEPAPRLVAKFAWTFAWQGVRAVRAFERRRRRGEIVPAFLFISVTDRCNLCCTGCWVSQNSPPRELPLHMLDSVIRDFKGYGCRFFGLLGGEPLLHAGLFDLVAAHPDCYFQVFSNGTLLTADAARTLRRLGNVTPLISIEGLERESDVRRGGSEVYARALEALHYCRENRLVFGVATSVCKDNFREVVTEAFVSAMVRRGAHYLWYYIYRPVGPRPAPDRALSVAEILSLRRFLVDVRTRAPIAIIDAYWDHEGRALCPAATGISYHIGPGGDIEPCPPVQFAGEGIGDGTGLGEAVRSSQFLSQFRATAAETTRGCLLLEQPAVMAELVRRTGARDSSGRGTALTELAAMQPKPGHHLPGQEIPERHWAYRFAKRHWFFGFGAYG